MVAGVTRIEAVTCDSPHEAALLERNLLEASLPPWNRTPGAQENLVYIRMVRRRAGALRHPRRAALPMVTTHVQPIQRHAAAGRHTGWLEGLRAAQRRTRRRPGGTLSVTCAAPPPAN
jgi:excinuclease UvrABC nuclease subunit